MPYDSSKCCEPKKKLFQGKAFIPDDHIQLISKYFQGANLNLNFTVDDDEESSDKDGCKKKRKTRSRSKKRKKKRRRKSKRCKCCKCHEDKCEVQKTCSCKTSVKCPPKLMKTTCHDEVDQCAHMANNCCCGGKTGNLFEVGCYEHKIDPCGAKCCFEGKTQPVTVKPSICCCKKPIEPEPEKICCCCGRPCVEQNNVETKTNMLKAKQDKTESSTKKGKSKPKLVEDGNHEHTSCCCKCRDHGNKEEANGDDNQFEVNNDRKEKSRKKGTKKPHAPKFSESSDSTASSIASGKNFKQVYVTKKVSSLENDEVYGRYWYHRPPLENTITHCDEGDYPGPSGYGNHYTGPSGYSNEYPGPSGYRNAHRPCEDGGQCDGRAQPPTSAYAYSALQYSETGGYFWKGSGRCLACKEPMCLSCKMNICDCDCDKPNFVICNPCKHRLTPKPPKKPCPPKKPKQKQQASGGCDEAMLLLPLLASMQSSMQGNNFQQCSC